MQSDEVVWQIINHGHCSFKARTLRQNFCRNEHNVTGLCNRSSCPLANSRYATIREWDGKIYLCMKTVERAHSPKRLWQRVKLSTNHAKALEQIDSHLAHWPKFLIHKNKQRLTKVTQYLNRMRRLALKTKTKIVPLPTKLKKRDKKREAKAVRAADIEKNIEKELLARLQAGTYGEIYNFPLAAYNNVLDKQAVPDGEELLRDGSEAGALRVKAGGEAGLRGEEQLGDSDAEEELDMQEAGTVDTDAESLEFVEDFEESDEDDIEDLAENLPGLQEADSSDDEEEFEDDADEDSEHEAEFDTEEHAGKRPQEVGRKRTRGRGGTGSRKRVELEHELEVDDGKPQGMTRLAR